MAGALTFVAWLALRGDAAFAVERLVTVLVIACPHALGLAVPLVIAISTTLGARSGLLVRDRRGLEEARNLTAVVFDKTGTLTLGEIGVVGDQRPCGDLGEPEALRLAAAVEQDSEHPIAQGIVRQRQRARDRACPRPTGSRPSPGVGVERPGGGTAAAGGRPGAAAGSLGVSSGRTSSVQSTQAAGEGQACHLPGRGRPRAARPGRLRRRGRDAAGVAGGRSAAARPAASRSSC